MNTYVPVRKIIKVVSTHRVAKRERHASLQECLESSTESRRRRCRWKPWAILLLISTALYFVFYRRVHIFPNMYEHMSSVSSNSIITHYEELSTVTTATVSTHVERKSTKNEIRSPEAVPKNESMDSASDGQLIRQKNYEDMPFCIRKKSYAKVSINKTCENITMNNLYPQVKKGGYYRPPNCKPKHRVGIIVPYRDREKNLAIFLYNIHAFLMNQKIEYQIFVIEQKGNELFNKGRLYNAGFKEMMKFNTFHCVVLHDLDLLPTNPSILYTCPTLPRHMCATVDDKDIRRDYNISYQFKSLFGGVVAMTIEQYERANGYSNLYFGWGAEDNDMLWRLRAAGYPVVRYNKLVGVYTVLPHTRQPKNPFRYHLLSNVVERYKTDGLSNIEYYVVSTKFNHLFTHIMVDINPRNDNITALTMGLHT